MAAEGASMSLAHRSRIQTEHLAHIGRRSRFICSCGTQTPWMDKEGAELAKDRHAWEQGQAGWKS